MLQTLAAAVLLGAAGPLPAETPTATSPRVVEVQRPRSFRLKYLSAQLTVPAVAADLRSAGRVAYLGFDMASNSVIYQGSAAAHARVVEFLPAYEEESRTELWTYRLRHVAAVDAARVLDDRIREDGVDVHVLAVEKLNAVLVNGTAASQARVAEYITALDCEPPAGRTR